MKLITNLISSFLMVSIVESLFVPTELPSPVIPAAAPTVNFSNGSLVDNIGSFSSQVSNAMCEANPTHLLCGTSVATGHKIIQNFPANTTIRHCGVFDASPHCCAQFCLPGTGGKCDVETGACFCQPAGIPNVCQLLMRSDSTCTAGMNQNDMNLLEICREKCTKNPSGCKKAAAATDGIVGTVCFCYCEP